VPDSADDLADLIARTWPLAKLADEWLDAREAEQYVRISTLILGKTPVRRALCCRCRHRIPPWVYFAKRGGITVGAARRSSPAFKLKTGC
jgi:hypothetical protein